MRLTKGHGGITFVGAAETNGDITKIAPGCGLMANFDFAVEPLTVVNENGIDKVAGMCGAGITGKLADQFTV